MNAINRPLAVVTGAPADIRTTSDFTGGARTPAARNLLAAHAMRLWIRMPKEFRFMMNLVLLGIVIGRAYAALEQRIQLNRVK